MPGFWSGKKILVTGGAGFIGSHVVSSLIESKGVAAGNIRVPRTEDCDLRIIDNARRAVEGTDVVIHLAADVGGLGYSRKFPATQYYNCTLLDLQIARAVQETGVSKFIALSSTTAYPAEAEFPLKEEGLFGKPPSDSHIGYGWAKRSLIPLAESFHKQYKIDSIVIIATNAYGPYDNFDPESSHVIPSLIRKCLEEMELVVWGDGTPVRDFIYAQDLAEGILLAAELLSGFEYLNIASGKGVSVADLVGSVSRLCEFKGQIVFDKSKPKGEPLRTVNIDKAGKLIKFKPRFSLEDGLAKTIKWFKEERKK